MDLFQEESVHKVDTGLNTLIYVLSWIGMILPRIIAVILFQSIFNQLFSGNFNLFSKYFPDLWRTYILMFTTRNNQKN